MNLTSLESLAIFVSWERWLFGIPVDQVDRVIEIPADGGVSDTGVGRASSLGDWLSLPGTARAIVMLRQGESATPLALAVSSCVGIGERPGELSPLGRRLFLDLKGILVGASPVPTTLDHRNALFEPVVLWLDAQLLSPSATP